MNLKWLPGQHTESFSILIIIWSKEMNENKTHSVLGIHTPESATNRLSWQAQNKSKVNQHSQMHKWCANLTRRSLSIKISPLQNIKLSSVHPSISECKHKGLTKPCMCRLDFSLPSNMFLNVLCNMTNKLSRRTISIWDHGLCLHPSAASASLFSVCMLMLTRPPSNQQLILRKGDVTEWAYPVRSEIKL